MTVAAVVLAAGLGRRFSASAPHLGPKLLVVVEGRPLVCHTVDALRDGGVTDIVAVVSPSSPEALRDTFEAEGVTVVTNPDPDRGMLSSIQAGLSGRVLAAPVCLVQPADMPMVRPATVRQVIAAAHGGRSVSPRLYGRGGHPVALSRALRLGVIDAPADASLRPLLYADDPIMLDVDDPGVLRDVDVIDDLPRRIQ